MRGWRSRISHSPSKTGVNALMCSIRATARRYAATSGPGDFKYCDVMACADQ